MLFSSTVFLFIFLPLTLIGYYLINKKYRNYLLLFASVVFYAWGEQTFIWIMFLSVFINYLFGLLVYKFKEKKKKAKLVLVGMFVWNIVIFFIYKYLNFTISNLNSLFTITIPQTDIALPIGISFFTFQAMSYVLDIYYDRGKVQKNPLNVALYIMLFPQLIAGPIVRYETVTEEINCREENVEDFTKGIGRFVIGLCKKLILSNSVAIIADSAFDVTNVAGLPVAAAWIGAIAYTLQIYFDFSGYSDMAIGLGLMFGFHFEENFNYPYCSKTVSEFWRRWHISLGTWFRDYVYFPLGGSRVKTKSRLVFNLFVVWLLTGVWHGANWTFVLWGLFYFAILTFEKLVGMAKIVEKNKILGVFYRIFTLFAVVIGWVLFRAKDISTAFSYMGAMFGITDNSLGFDVMYQFSQNNFLMLWAMIFSIPIVPFVCKKIGARIDSSNKAAVIAVGVTEKVIIVALFALAISYAVCVSFNPFIYFNF